MDSNVYLEVTSALGKKIRITKDYWSKLIETKHSIMEGKEGIIKRTLENPDQIRRSRKDPTVFLYYKKVNHHYNCVVAKHLNGEGFIITAYLTDRIKAGEEYETD